MTLTYRSTIPERFEIRGVDTNGRERVATATRHAGDFHWKLRLQHPSGQFFDGSFRGEQVLSALSEMVNAHDSAYRQDRARGYRPEPKPRDYTRQVLDDGEFAPIIPIPQRRS
jgi:hypothetical protein